MSGNPLKFIEVIEDIGKLGERVAPWAEVLMPLIAALEDGHFTREEFVAVAKRVMTEAMEEKLKRELPP